MATSDVEDMTSSAPPEWAVGDPDDLPDWRTEFWDTFALDDDRDDDGDSEGEGLVRFSVDWWTHQLLTDPLTGSVAERRRIRPALAAAVDLPPGPAQIAALDALNTALNMNTAVSAAAGLHEPEATGVGAGGVGLSSREWTEVTTAVERCVSCLHALKLTCVLGLDSAKLTENPTRARARDSRRPAADELAPALRIAGRTATHLVGLARQLHHLPAAEDALARGLMTPAQLDVLADVCRRLPEGPTGQRPRRAVEARAVAAAATLSRARLVGVLDEAALAADPGYAARSMAAGIGERDVVLRRSSVPGCRQVVATMETADAARVWQVINQVAANAKDGDTYATTPTDTSIDTEEQEQGQEGQGREQRTLAQLRADVLVSLVVGDFSLTPATIAQALCHPTPSTTPEAPAAEDDEDGVGEDDGAGGAGEEAGERAPVSGLVPDTRRPVRIPSPEQRARLSEVHVVVFSDDLADLDEDPEDGPDDGPGEGPDDSPGDSPGDGPGRGPGDGPDDDAPPLGPDGALADDADGADGRDAGPTGSPGFPPPDRSDPPPERPRPTTAHTRTNHPGDPDQLVQPVQPYSPPAAPSPTSSPTGSSAQQRLRAARAARATRRPLTGYGPFGHVPGIGRLSPEITRAALRTARWRRLVADPTTAVLLHRSRWTLPAPDTITSTSTSTSSRRSTAEHLALLMQQGAAPDPNDPATRTEVTYRPSVLLAQHVRTRDAGCISPVCHHPARAGATQLDHTVAYGPHTPTRLRGGLTEAGNLGCICVRWHDAKTHGDWELAQPSPGTFTWTSSTGLVHHRRATPLLPDLTDLAD